MKESHSGNPVISSNQNRASQNQGNSIRASQNQGNSIRVSQNQGNSTGHSKVEESPIGRNKNERNLVIRASKGNTRGSVIKVTVAEDITKADLTKALTYKELNTINELLLDGSSKPYPLDVDNVQLAKYGIGIYLYFEFVKRAAIVFLIMALFSIVPMASNATGNGLDAFRDVSSLMQISVANQPQLYIETTNSTNQTIIDQVAQDNKLNLQYYVQQMENRHLLVSITDFLYTIVFIIFIIQFTYHSKQLIKQSQKTNQLPTQFAVIIKNFSPRLTDPTELKTFLSKYGQIYEVKLARNYHNTLFLHKKESELTLKLKIEYVKAGTPSYDDSYVQSLIANLTKTKQNLEGVLSGRFGSQIDGHLHHDQYPSLKAFVIFETQLERINFINQYKKDTYLPSYNCLFGDHKYVIPKQHLFQGQYKLEVEPKVENPSDVKWENLEVTKTLRYSKLFCVFMLVLCLMVITFAIIFVANIVQPADPNLCPQSNYSLQEVQALVDAALTKAQKKTLKQCFCYAQNIAILYANNSDISTFCQSTITTYTINTGIAIVSGFVILIVNVLLENLLQALGGFPRYPSISKQVSATMINMFIVLFINTALITLFLQADIYGFKPAIIISQPIPPLAVAQEDQTQTFPSDLDRNWYVIVGTKIINTWIYNVLSPHMIIFLILPLTRWSRKRNALSSIVQRQMNQWIVGSDFTLTVYYAQALNTIFVTMFYCSGMPLMLAFGSFSLFFQYASYKYILLRFARKPPTFDQNLNEKALKVLPMAVLLHIVIALYVYGAPLIFPYSADSLQITSSSISNNQVTTISTTTGFSNVLLERMAKTPWLSALGFMIILYYIIGTTLFEPVRLAVQNYFSEDNKVQDFDDTTPLKYSQIYETIRHSTLATYEIRANEQYIDIIQAMDMIVNSPLTQKQHNTEEQDHLIHDNGQL